MFVALGFNAMNIAIPSTAKDADSGITGFRLFSLINRISQLCIKGSIIVASKGCANYVSAIKTQTMIGKHDF